MSNVSLSVEGRIKAAQTVPVERFDLDCATWSPIYNYPKVRCPGRSKVISSATWKNDHGVLYEASIHTNRTQSRFWLIVLIGEGKDGALLHQYWTTTSKEKLKSWMDAIEEKKSKSTTKKEDLSCW